MRRITLLVTLTLLIVSTTTATAQRTSPYNLVVVVLDSSISFQLPSKQAGSEGRVPVADALRVVQRLFSAGSAEKRRRTAKDDQYVIIAADAMSQVIWQGNRTELTDLTPEALLGFLKARREFANCTDFKSALNTAAKVMQQSADATDFYVLTFGDLIHEPATTSYRVCAAQSGQPPAGIDWDTLKYAALGFYFVSTNFNLRPNMYWPEHLETLDIHADFRDMAQTLTQPLELPPPAQAKYRATQEDLNAAAARLASMKAFGWAGLKWGGGLLLFIFLGGPVILWFLRRRVAGSQQGARNA